MRFLLEKSPLLDVFWPRAGLQANHGTVRKSANKSRIKKMSTCGMSTVQVTLHAKAEVETIKMAATLNTWVQREAEKGASLYLHRIRTTKDFSKKSVSVLFFCFSSVNSLSSPAFQSFAFFLLLQFKLSKSLTFA